MLMIARSRVLRHCPSSAVISAGVDPKPENETARNLKSAVRMWSFERKAEGVHHAEKRSQRREDSLRTAPGRRGQKGRRHVPRDGRVATDVLHLASTICRVRGE